MLQQFYLAQYLIQNQKEKAEEISRFYEDIKLYPYQIADIIRLKAEMEIDDIKLQEMLKTSFARTKDVGIFSYEELAEFIRLELNEKNEESQKMCSALAKAATEPFLCANENEHLLAMGKCSFFILRYCRWPHPG